MIMMSNSTAAMTTTTDDGDSKPAMRVYFRLRPMNKMETSRRAKHCIEVGKDHSSVRVHSSLEGEHDFFVDQVLEEDAGQEEVYQTAAAHVPYKLLQGVSCSVIAYGQTGTGKTHTMLGYHDPDERIDTNNMTTATQTRRTKSHGVIQRTVAELFDLIKSESSCSTTTVFTIRCSYIELYLEKIQDLLQPSSSNDVHLVEGESRIAGVSELCCLSLADVLLLLERGNACRTSSATQMNADSSRSHAIFILRLDQTDRLTGKSKSSTLHMADLAGSEFVQKGPGGGGGTIMNSDVGLAESSMIQKSLAALNNMVRSRLDMQQKQQRPESQRHEFPTQPSQRCKLTRVLHEAFGGNSCTTLILTASPSSFYASETTHTLQFGEMCRELINRPVVSDYWSMDMYRRQIVKCQQQQGQCTSLLELLSNELTQGSSSPMQLQQTILQALGISKGTENTLSSLSAGDASNNSAEKPSLTIKPVSSFSSRDQRAEVDAAVRAKEQAERLVQRLQSEVAILQAQNESLENEKSKYFQELTEAKNEIQVLCQRRLEVEHNLRTSQFRENEATVFLRQFRRFYRRLLNHKAVQGSGREPGEILQAVAEHIPGTPDLSEMVDIDKLMVESGLLEDYEVGEDTAATEYFPTSAALVRSSTAAKNAAEAEKAAAQTNNNGQFRSFQGPTASNTTENGHKHQNLWKDESAVPKWQRQVQLQTPAGRFTKMQEEDLEKQFMELSQRCVQLQKQLDSEKSNADVLATRNGNPKQLEMQVVSLGQELEEKSHELQAIAWKMSELHLVNKAYSEKLANREIHMAYLEENLSDLQTSNVQLSVERQETEAALRDETRSLRQQLQALTAPLWQLGEGSAQSKCLTSRIIVSFLGGNIGAEPFKYERRMSTGGVEPLDLDTPMTSREKEAKAALSLQRANSVNQLASDHVGNNAEVKPSLSLQRTNSVTQLASYQFGNKSEPELNRTFVALNTSFGPKRSYADSSPGGKNVTSVASGSPWAKASKPPIAPWLKRQNSTNHLRTISNNEFEANQDGPTKREDQVESGTQFDPNMSSNSFSDSQRSMHLSSIFGVSPKDVNGRKTLSSSPTKSPKPQVTPWSKQQGQSASRNELNYKGNEWPTDTNNSCSTPWSTQQTWSATRNDLNYHRTNDMNDTSAPSQTPKLDQLQFQNAEETFYADTKPTEEAATTTMPTQQNEAERDPRHDASNFGNSTLASTTTLKMPSPRQNKISHPPVTRRPPPAGMHRRWSFNCGNGQKDEAAKVSPLSPHASTTDHPSLMENRKSLYERTSSQTSFNQGRNDSSDNQRAPNVLKLRPANAAQAELFARIRTLGHKRPEDVLEATGSVTFDPKAQDKTGFKVLERRLCADNPYRSSDASNTSFGSDNPRLSKPDSSHSRATTLAKEEEAKVPSPVIPPNRLTEESQNRFIAASKWPVRQHSFRGGDEATKVEIPHGVARARRASGLARGASFTLRNVDDKADSSSMNGSTTSGFNLDDDTSKSGSEALHASVNSNFLLVDEDEDDTGRAGSRSGGKGDESEHNNESAKSFSLKDNSTSRRGYTSSFHQNTGSFRSIKFDDNPSDDGQQSVNGSVGSNFLMSEVEVDNDDDGDDDSLTAEDKSKNHNSFINNSYNSHSFRRKSTSGDDFSVASRVSRDPDALYAGSHGVGKLPQAASRNGGPTTALDRGMTNTSLNQSQTNDKPGKLTTFFGKQQQADPPSITNATTPAAAMNANLCSDTVSELRTLESVVGSRPKVVNHSSTTEDYWETEGSKESPTKKTETTDTTAASSSPTPLPAGFSYPLEDWLAGRKSPSERKSPTKSPKTKKTSSSKNHSSITKLEIEFDADLFDGMSLANFEPAQHGGGGRGKSKASSPDKEESKKKKSSSSSKAKKTDKTDKSEKKKKKKSKDDETSTKKDKNKKEKIKKTKKSPATPDSGSDASGAFETENFGGMSDGSDHENHSGLNGKTNHSFGTTATSDLFCVVTPGVQAAAAEQGKKKKKSSRSKIDC